MWFISLFLWRNRKYTDIYQQKLLHLFYTGLNCVQYTLFTHLLSSSSSSINPDSHLGHVYSCKTRQQYEQTHNVVLWLWGKKPQHLSILLTRCTFFAKCNNCCHSCNIIPYKKVYVLLLFLKGKINILTCVWLRVGLVPQRIRSCVQEAEISFFWRVAGVSLWDRMRSSVNKVGVRVKPLLLHIKKKLAKVDEHRRRIPPRWAVSGPRAA